MTKLTDLQLITVTWNEANTATTAGQLLSDLDTSDVTFNPRSATGYIVGIRDGATILAQVSLIDAVYIPTGAIISTTPHTEITINAPTIASSVDTSVDTVSGATETDQEVSTPTISESDGTV